MLTLSELIPKYDWQKSFYGRAEVLKTKNKSVLFSYLTPVAMIKNGKFYRLWDDYSATTQKHINEFLQQHGMQKLSKKQWCSLPITKRGVKKVEEEYYAATLI